MGRNTSHDTTARRIASKQQTTYNRGAGADIKTKNVAIEVETPQTVSDGTRQLQGHRKPVYIAGTIQEAVKKALHVTRGTTIGVMDNKGNIIKPSTRRKQ